MLSLKSQFDNQNIDFIEILPVDRPRWRRSVTCVLLCKSKIFCPLGKAQIANLR
jgi:hypothetical protein